MPVKVTGLRLAAWAIGDHVGLTFRAAKVESLPAADVETGRQAQQWSATGFHR